MTRLLSLLFCLATLVVRAEKSQAAFDDAGGAFLMRELGFTEDDLRGVGNGRVAFRQLATEDGREVAAAGIVRVAITPAEFVRRLTDIASFKKADAVLQIGTFSAPRDITDVAGLTLPSADVRNLRSCRVGDCGMQLPSYIIDPDEFRDLVSSDTRVLPTFPDLRRHLMTALTSAPTVSDVLYWSKEKVARKEVVSVTHLAIARQPSTSPFAYVAGSKQLYGSHYFDAALGLTIVLRDPTSRASAYVAYVNRSRVDAFGGLFGGITRRIVRSRARGALADFLEVLQRRLETGGSLE